MLGIGEAALALSPASNNWFDFSPELKKEHEVPPLQPRAYIAKACSPLDDRPRDCFIAFGYLGAIEIEIPNSLRSRGVLYGFRFVSDNAALRFVDTPVGVGVVGLPSYKRKDSMWFVLGISKMQQGLPLKPFSFSLEITPYLPSGLKGTPLTLHYEEPIADQ